jgi:hypothetical protein
MKRATIFVCVLLAISGCNEGDRGEDAAPTPTVGYKPTAEGTVTKPGAPFSLEYKVIGTPIIGSPVPIELRVTSVPGMQPMTISYTVHDGTALKFPEAQAEKVNITPAANEASIDQMITVIPMREGRQYVNVTVSIETESGSSSLVMAVPIQVGEGGRLLEEHGELSTDEEGESIRTLPGDRP